MATRKQRDPKEAKSWSPNKKKVEEDTGKVTKKPTSPSRRLAPQYQFLGMVSENSGRWKISIIPDEDRWFLESGDNAIVIMARRRGKTIARFMTASKVYDKRYKTSTLAGFVKAVIKDLRAAKINSALVTGDSDIVDFVNVRKEGKYTDTEKVIQRSVSRYRISASSIDLTSPLMEWHYVDCIRALDSKEPSQIDATVGGNLFDILTGELKLSKKQKGVK